MPSWSKQDIKFISLYFSIFNHNNYYFNCASCVFVGENAIVIVSGANQCLEKEEVWAARDVVAGAKVVVCQLEIAPETTLAALKMAKELGGKLL